MELSIEPGEGEVRRVALKGNLDIAGAGTIEMRFAAVAGAARRLVVDLAGVTFLASIGMRLLVVNAKTLARRGGGMVLYRPAEMVARSLEVAGIDQVIPVVHDEAALAAAIDGRSA